MPVENKISHCSFCGNNKEVVKERTKNYVEKLKNENPDKLKEWRRNYYLKKKEKKKEEQSI